MTKCSACSKMRPTCSPARWGSRNAATCGWRKVSNPFPHFDVPAGFTLDSYFEHVSREGFARRLETLRPLAEQGRLKHSLPDYEQRLARELAIIQQMKFSGYFLIVWDFIRYAREHEIPVGPGRGSAAGSLVSYSLGITDLDPLQHELIFERFLNPERVSMPDIDIDFCMNRRGEVINYVTNKYGRENVAQIITFGTMAAKAAIKDVGRAMGVLYAEVDRIAKMVPTTLNITLEARDQGIARAAAGLRERHPDSRIARHRQEAGRHGAQRRRARGRSRDFAAAIELNWCRCTRPRTTKSSPPSTWWRSKSWACSRWTSWA